MNLRLPFLVLSIFLCFSFIGCDQNEYGDWKKEGEAFLEANKSDPDVIVTKTGLQYKILVNSQSQERPQSVNSVKVNFTASFTNGTVFDSGTNTVFAVSDLIPGFQEAILKMKLGSKWKLFIPYSLAYGSTGTKKSNDEYIVPPYSAIIYEVELVQIY